MKPVAILTLILLPAIVWGQDEFETPLSNSAQFRSLIDIPTAGILARGEYDFEMRIFPEGGILGGFNVGLFDRFNMGIYYGGTEIIGDSANIGWNDQPGIDVRYRLFEEGSVFPATAIGYTNQGFGKFDTGLSTGDRYRIKSRGFYAAFSKNYLIKGNDFSVHAGLNYNTMEREDDEGMNLFTGVEFPLNNELALLAEYDFAWNDNGDQSYGEGKGYLNGGIRWTFADHLLLQFDMKDILGNFKGSDTIGREIKIVYKQKI
jgi:hypothetical protein